MGYVLALKVDNYCKACVGPFESFELAAKYGDEIKGPNPERSYEVFILQAPFIDTGVPHVEIIIGEK